MGDAIEAKAKFAIDVGSRICEFDGAGNVDLAIVVRALRVGASSTGCQVPPE